MIFKKLKVKFEEKAFARCFLLVKFIICTIPGYCQHLDLRFDQINTEHGLAQNTITGIAKDKFGFMWFGTWEGLCRYDGYKFKIYRYRQNDSRSIINNKIYNITKDTKGNLWIFTFNDTIVCRYQYSSDDFDRIPLRKLSKKFALQITRDWHLDHASIKYKDFEWNLGKVKKNLIQTHLPTGKKKEYDTASSSNKQTLNDPFVTDLFLDDQHILWVGTYSNGINKANLNAKPFRHIEQIPGTNKSILNNNVHTIAEDKQGNLWVGTRDKGISVISQRHTYRHFKQGKDSDYNLSSNIIKNIFCDSRGYIWIGTLRGLDGFDPKSNELRHYRKAGLGSEHVYYTYEDRYQDLWFAAWNGIYKYNTAQDSFFRINTKGLPSRLAMAILEDNAGRIWIGTQGGGIAIFERSGRNTLKIAKVLRHIDGQPSSISDNRVLCLYKDGTNYIWIGTGDGLDRFDVTNNAIHHFKNGPNGLGSSNITSIVGDNSGNIWVSHTNGVSRINKQTLKIRNFSTQDGLQGNDFSDGGIYRSKTTGHLYIAGNRGYNVFYPDSIKSDFNLPTVLLTELQILNKPVGVRDSVNGRVPLMQPLYMSKEIVLKYEDKSFAIEFAALHYTNPLGNKYAYKLYDFDKDWVYTDARNRLATYSNLPPGNYTFMVRAANSDGIWNPKITSLKINVLPPWWKSSFAYICYILLLATTLYAAYLFISLKNKLRYEVLLHERESDMHKSKIQFFTNISHEIKTPLSLILAPLEKLLSENKENTTITRQLLTMKSSGDRLLRLINQLLDLRRIETGNDQLQIQDEDLIKFVQRIVDSFAALAYERRINLRFEVAPESISTNFDPDKMEKVLYNLLSNAFKFTPCGGNIEVSIKADENNTGNWATIEIVDNGAGIPEKELEIIFEPFKQASTNKVGGTGLGLAYAKALVQMHRGKIYANSTIGIEGENRTCFIVQLPLATKAKQIERIEQSQLVIEEDAQQQKGPKEVLPTEAPLLLIVDDSRELRNYLRDHFSKIYRVITASDGLEGLSLSNGYMPDLIISDMMMPEMDGLELCRRLKTSIITSHIPVILLTARTQIEQQIEGIKTGADDYITKPFNLGLLAAKIKNLLSLRLKLQEKYRTSIHLPLNQIIPESPDDKLLKKVMELVAKDIGDSDLDMNRICNHVGLSRTHLYRKMKALTGQTMAEVVKDVRLKHARSLLETKKFNVSEVAYMVGFNDPEYFRKCFKALFGISPSEFKKTDA